MTDTTDKQDKPGYNDTEAYALELIERWRERLWREFLVFDGDWYDFIRS